MILLMAANTATHAQDTIFTTKGEEIIVKVTEIDTVIVKFKRYDNQDGPTYIIKQSDIVYIIYHNGAMDVFQSWQRDEISKYVPEQHPLYYEFKSLVYNDDKMSDFLKKHDFQCYRTFHTGENLKAIGIGFFIPAMTLSVGGIILTIAGVSKNNEFMALIGRSSLAVGQAFMVTSIPFLSVGGALKNKAKRAYEDKYFNNNTSSLNLNVYSNGLGLTLSF